MSDNIPKYKATDKMSDLICENYTLLMVMSRFGLPLGNVLCRFYKCTGSQ